jgi:hypothetical protein
MQIQYGFTAVTLITMLALRARLDEGSWGKVKAVKREALGAGQPAAVVVKTMLVHLLGEAVSAATEASEASLEAIDARWDRAQRRLALALLAALQSEDAGEQAAAQALSDALVAGEQGTGQTAWTYQREADWGEAQLERASSAELVAHIKKLGLQGHMADIAATTKELVAALGRSPDEAAKEARSIRERRLHREISIVLNSALSQLDAIIAHTTDADERQEAQALRAPIADLLTAR